MTSPFRGILTDRAAEGVKPSPAWHALGAAGLALLVMGGVDILLAWIPLRIGDPEWEFGTISATLNNMPVPVMGLALVLAHAAAWNSRVAQGLALIWSVLVLLVLLGAAVLYALDVPLALRAVQDPLPRRALRSGMVKAGVAFVVYAAFHLWAAVFSTRLFRRA